MLYYGYFICIILLFFLSHRLFANMLLSFADKSVLTFQNSSMANPSVNYILKNMGCTNYIKHFVNLSFTV